MDRERLADIIDVMDGLEGFVGVFDLGSRVVVGVSDARSRGQAAARLTALTPLDDVEVLIQPSRMPSRFVATSRERNSAAQRTAARHAEWESYKLEVEARLPTRANRAIFVVAKDASTFAGALRAAARAPLITYAKEHVEHVPELIASYKNVNAVALDPDLPGADRLAEWLARTWSWIPIVRASSAPEDRSRRRVRCRSRSRRGRA